MPWSVTDYNTNPALNTSINGTDIAENSAAAGYNDALRQMMADIKTWTNSYAITSPVSIAQGGTGQTTAGNALAALGGLADTYRDLPFIAKGGAFTFANNERSCSLNYTGAAAAATINPQVSTAINTGAVFVIRNGGSGALTLTRGAGVFLFSNGAVASANAVLAIGGVATLIYWGSDTWTLTGSGIS